MIPGNSKVEDLLKMGINVWMWGPSMWRLLFGAARNVHQLLPHGRAQGMAACSPDERAMIRWFCTFVRATTAIVPCPFCRPSSQQFLREIETEGGASLAEQVARGHVLQAMYQLRAKVNMKLQTQHLRKHVTLAAAQGLGMQSVVTFKNKTCSVPPRNIKFMTWRQRLLLPHQVFGAQDVETMLNALRLDFAPGRERAYTAFWVCVAKLVQLDVRMERPHVLPAPRAALQNYSNILHPLASIARLQPELLGTRVGFERLLLQLMAGARGLRPRDTGGVHKLGRRLFSPYNVMQVGVLCAEETCSN
jgi:hypothetical protein